MIPVNITREHILTAIKEIEKYGVEPKREALKYHLLYNGRTFPPKFVVSKANKYANGSELDPDEFNGGDEANKFLKERGFEIIEDPNLWLIEKYKKRIAQKGLENEIYKWEIVKKYAGRPDLDAEDFYGEFLSIKLENLVDWRMIDILKQLAKKDPEKLRALFRELFDEDEELLRRMRNFYEGIGDRNLDARTIAAYLTLHNPRKYTFYKYTFYNAYCKLLGEKEVSDKLEKYVHYMSLVAKLIETIAKDNELIDMVKSMISAEYFDERNLNLLAQDILYQVLDQESREAKKEEKRSHNERSKTKERKMHLNTILYGPPGTGKTYYTINKALEIIAQKDAGLQEFLESDPSRDEVKEKFNAYKESGQIEFVTFHQSFGYEEFVEGLKAESNDGEIEYKVEDGIFKKVTKEAIKNYENSLKDEEKLTKEEEFYKKLEILKDEIEEHIAKNGFYPLEDTIVYIESVTDNSFRYRSKNWKNAISMSFDSLKELYLNDVKERKEIKNIDTVTATAKEHASYFFRILKKLYDIKVDRVRVEREPLKNYILIIDEINRGNISKILGELITLIEPSKRIGAKEELIVKLPYSNDDFGVPQNLYIIGTMNTADRSIAPIDTALRRRFVFEEMMPKPELLEVVDGIDLQKLLEAINARIEYIYDREHTIGHSYFLDVEDIDDLKDVFQNRILPLLAEYFYEDWGNIDLILNKNGFIEESKAQNSYLQILQDADNIANDKKIYKIKDMDEWSECHFQKIYGEACETSEDER